MNPKELAGRAALKFIENDINPMPTQPTSTQ